MADYLELLVFCGLVAGMETSKKFLCYFCNYKYIKFYSLPSKQYVHT